MNKKIEIYSTLNRLMNRAGLDLRRFPTRQQRMLLKYLKDNDVNNCLDVGANVGQYATMIRSAGFKGQIFSFEPQKKAFQQLTKSAARDKFWSVFNIGLGDTDDTVNLNISSNSVSSSMLPMDDALKTAAPEAHFISTELIQVNRLDSIINGLADKKRLFLKIDAQGFESKILDGAVGCFNDIFALQLELACVELYTGEKLFDEMKAFVESKGFYLSSVESGFSDASSGRLLEVETIFLREV